MNFIELEKTFQYLQSKGVDLSTLDDLASKIVEEKGLEKCNVHADLMQAVSWIRSLPVRELSGFQWRVSIDSCSYAGRVSVLLGENLQYVEHVTDDESILYLCSNERDVLKRRADELCPTDLDEMPKFDNIGIDLFGDFRQHFSAIDPIGFELHERNRRKCTYSEIYQRHRRKR